tara:strand:- start:2794 stop:3639 length:846 start_codon:yes stop_codon:yes gene_type:complete
MYDFLITGGTGFIGSRLIQNFKNKKILVISRKKIKIKNKLVRVIIYKSFSDLILKLKRIKARHIIHCATHYTKNHKINDIQKIFEANILLGNILLECSKEMNVKKFINLSTVWELNYNNSNDYLNLYTLSKKIFSKIINFYSIKNKNLKIYNIYLLDTFGEGDKRNKILNEIKKKINNNKKIMIESENLTMNFLNIKDVISAIEIVKNGNNLKKKDYVVCNTKNFKIKKIIEKYNFLNKKKIKYKFLGKKKIGPKLPNISKLPNWQINHSKMLDIIKFLKN